MSVAWNVCLSRNQRHLTAAYLQTRVADPLLCLTVAATLRGKTLVDTPQRQDLTAALVQRGILPSSSLNPSASADELEDEEDIMNGMEEVNLLDVLNDGTFDPLNTSKADMYCLSSGLTFTSNKPLSLTTARLGENLRRNGFSLPPIMPSSPHSTSTNGESSPRNSSAPVLRKAYRKTISTASGIRVRMRNCLVPYVLPLHEATTNDEEDGVNLEDEPGGEERTVMLSIELENSPDAGAGFVVESVEITVSGDGSKANLIGWGEHLMNGEGVFPLNLSAADQVNLLYAVSFLHPPNTNDIDLSVSERQRKRQSGVNINELQRAVTIVVRGHPSHHPSSDSFASRWNCILDLTPTAAQLQAEYPLGTRDALPTPASPFPSSHSSPNMPRSARGGLGMVPALAKSLPVSVAGSKHLSASGLAYSISGPSPTPSQSSSRRESSSNHPTSTTSPGKSRFVPTPPSAIFAAMNTNSGLYPRAPSADTPTPRSSNFPGGISNAPVPPTPAFPSYAEGPPPTPFSQFPIGPPAPTDSHINETRRERLGSTILPQAETATVKGGPLPLVGTTEDANMLVSVALLPPRSGNEVFPLDVFALEIFLFNRSNSIRRCEVGYPERLRRRNESVGGTSPVGILPLDNRIRVG